MFNQQGVHAVLSGNMQMNKILKIPPHLLVVVVVGGGGGGGGGGGDLIPCEAKGQ